MHILPFLSPNAIDPLQRLLLHGPAALSDAELMAVVMGGPPGRSLPLMQALLAAHGNHLWRVARCSPAELLRIPGLSPRRCGALLSALHLGLRRAEPYTDTRPHVTNSAAAYDLLRPCLADLPHEEFWMLTLDRGNRLLASTRVGVGGPHGTVADPKTIFKHALDQRASSLVVAHNHPSGQLRPSEEDIRLTGRLADAGRMLDLTVQDHLIVTPTGYYSFADNGVLPRCG